MRTVSHRIRAALAVLAVVAAVRVVRDQRRRLERAEQALVAERAGQRLVDCVVQTDFEERLARLRAAVAAAPAAYPSSSTRSNSQEGGL
ncbi:hypothetical protein ACFVWR_18485 [Leifsonia sp. NPDC058292]|uniref:hypothetical protein n=1 Tax=Leifsonia sp. NPDC058292 TaxID=3346428 RepID=UPI0036DD49B5